jgi:hypothetical protein
MTNQQTLRHNRERLAQLLQGAQRAAQTLTARSATYAAEAGQAFAHDGEGGDVARGRTITQHVADAVAAMEGARQAQQRADVLAAALVAADADLADLSAP